MLVSRVPEGHNFNSSGFWSGKAAWRKMDAGFAIGAESKWKIRWQFAQAAVR